MLALVVEPKTYVVRGWDGTGAGSGSKHPAVTVLGGVRFLVLKTLMRQHAYLELKFALVVGACGTGAGSGSGCVACCIMLCSCCSGWYWVSASAVSRASFFPGLLLFVPAGVSG